jgi:hypothetical protein
MKKEVEQPIDNWINESFVPDKTIKRRNSHIGRSVLIYMMLLAERSVD